MGVRSSVGVILNLLFLNILDLLLLEVLLAMCRVSV
jgi:hypothetical protein